MGVTRRRIISNPARNLYVNANPIQISASTILQFYSEGSTVAVNTEVYTILPLLTTANPAGENYYSSQNIPVTLTQTNGQTGATIYYPADKGGDPTTSLTRQTYTTPILISTPTTLKFASHYRRHLGNSENRILCLATIANQGHSGRRNL